VDDSQAVWEVYEQAVYEGDPPPGPGWEPFGVVGAVEHNGLRESLGGGYEHRLVVVWRRKLPSHGVGQ